MKNLTTILFLGPLAAASAFSPWPTLLASSRPISVTRMRANHSEDDRRLLREVLKEAIEANGKIRRALEDQLLLPRPGTLALPDPSDDKAKREHRKAIRRAEQVPIRLAEIQAAENKLIELQETLQRESDLGLLRRDMEDIGLGRRVESFDLDSVKLAQWGRPQGFEGLVVESPKGIPILITGQSYSDSFLRRISKGGDLWFQVREGRGSRVLLRTSMVRSLSKSPRECMEAAADFAAYFCDTARRSGGKSETGDEIEVIYTDSRKVAKRGGRVGQLKDAKKLGVIRAKPWRVVKEAKAAQEEQGRL